MGARAKWRMVDWFRAMADSYSAVLFDMDGLLLDTERIYVRAQRQAASEFGFEASDDLLHSFVGVSGKECIRMMVEAAGDGFPVEEYQLRWYQTWRQLVADDGVPVRSGIEPLLGWLVDEGVARGVVTSTHRKDAELCLRAAGVYDVFDYVTTGDEVTHNKPAPDIYLLGAERMGVAPAECIALEDSDAGVLSAAAAGLRTIMVPDLRQPSPEARAAAYTVVSTLGEAESLVKAWLVVDK